VLAEPRLQPGNNLGRDHQPTVKWTHVSTAPTPS